MKIYFSLSQIDIFIHFKLNQPPHVTYIRSIFRWLLGTDCSDTTVQGQVTAVQHWDLGQGDAPEQHDPPLSNLFQNIISNGKV